MRDLEKLVELGREFAKPWKQATKVLAVLLVASIIGLVVLAYRDSSILLEADYNTHSEVLQVQG
jgi:hypothetical protein